MRKIERYNRFKLRRLVRGQIEYITVSAFRSPTNGKHEVTIHAAYESGVLMDGGARVVRIPRESRAVGRAKFVAEATQKVVQHFVAQGYTLINPDFVVW